MGGFSFNRSIRMSEPTIATGIWNRACGQGASMPGPGDVALAAVLTFHGMVMHVGALDAIESLTADELAAARDGYRYFGYGNVAGIIGAGQAVLAQGLDAAALAETLDDAYAAIIEDGAIMHAFVAHYDREPAAYAPLQDG
jgi:hypothetical protein